MSGRYGVLLSELREGCRCTVNELPMSKLVTQEHAQITGMSLLLVVIIGLFMWALFGFAFVGVMSLVFGKW